MPEPEEVPGAASIPRWTITLGVHSLAWLVVGNAVGMLLASLLLFPDLGRVLGSLTYGRWAAVHLDVQLYGWCALPLLGVLLRWMLADDSDRWIWVAINGWSAAVGLGVLSWLAGITSGKLFLDWRSGARTAFLTTLLLLTLLLAAGLWRRPDLDRRHGLCSLPARLGSAAAMRCARWLHLLAFVGFAAAGVEGSLGSPYLVALLLAGGALWAQHRLVGPGDLSRIRLSFFTLNALVSSVLCLGAWAAVAAAV